MTKIVRIPRRFFIDHEERDLPAPDVLKHTRSQYHISIDHNAFGELCSDTEFYCTPTAAGGYEAYYRQPAVDLRASLIKQGAWPVKYGGTLTNYGDDVSGYPGF